MVRSSIEEIAEHYAFFLRLYHKSERTYIQNQQTTVKITPTETEEIKKRLKALSELMERLKIQQQPK